MRNEVIRTALLVAIALLLVIGWHASAAPLPCMTWDAVRHVCVEWGVP